MRMYHDRIIDQFLDTTVTSYCLPNHSSSVAIVYPFYIVLDFRNLLVNDIEGSFVGCSATVFRIAYYRLICIG